MVDDFMGFTLKKPKSSYKEKKEKDREIRETFKQSM